MIDTIFALGDDFLSNQFKVIIPDFPGAGGNTDNLVFRITELQIPETAVATYEVHYGTQKFTKPSGKNDTQNEFVFSYRMDKFSEVYEKMEKWVNAALNQFSGAMASDIPGSLRRDITVIGLDSYGNETNQGWQFIGCWPSRHASVQLSQDNGEPVIAEVTMQFMKKVFLGKGERIVNDGSAAAVVGTNA